MLEGLDAVDWPNLEDAFGPATEVPGLIRNLASSEPEVRASALENLTNRIWHQTALYQATPYAIPFIINLLTHEEVEDKHLLLGMLWGMSSAGASIVHPPYSDASLQPSNASPGRAVYEEARKGITTYFPFLTSFNARARASAADLLSLFGEDAPRIAPRLRAAIDAEADPLVKAEMVSGLGFLLAAGKAQMGDAAASYIPYLLSVINSSEEEAIRFAAAIAITPLAGGATPQTVVDLLLDAISRPSAYSRFFTPLAVPGEAARALAHIGRQQGVTALIEGLRRSTDYTSAHDIIEHLLDLAFGGKQALHYARTYRTARDGTREIRYAPRTAFRSDASGMTAVIPSTTHIRSVERLSADERRAVKAIVQAASAWTYRTNLYELYGLPANREDLRRMVEAS